jgi:pimeloyl-ACP methyl ester carboxylesterase
MRQLRRNDVGLSYEERGAGEPPALLIHAWGADSTFMRPLLEHLGTGRRTVAVDLRGHGQSSQPESDYTMQTFVDDLVWLTDRLGLRRPVIIGHSLGGMIALALAASSPNFASAVILLDSPVVAPPGLIDEFRSVIEPLRSPRYPQVMRQFIGSFVGFADDATRRERILDQMAANPQRPMVSALEHCLAQDTARDAASCKVPLLYVSSGPWYTDVSSLRELCPQLVTGQTVGSGHFHTIEVPDQVNAMVGRFLATAAKAPGVIAQAR